MVEEDAEVDPGNGVVDVSVVEDNVGALPAQFEGDFLQIGASGCFHDLTTNNCTTGESDLVDIHVGGNGSPGDLTETGEDVDDAGWEASFLDEVAHVERGQWGLFGGLENDDITAGNGRANLP